MSAEPVDAPQLVSGVEVALDFEVVMEKPGEGVVARRYRRRGDGALFRVVGHRTGDSALLVRVPS